jgi:hypothetical protein
VTRAWRVAAHPSTLELCMKHASPPLTAYALHAPPSPLLALHLLPSVVSMVVIQQPFGIRVLGLLFLGHPAPPVGIPWGTVRELLGYVLSSRQGYEVTTLGVGPLLSKVNPTEPPTCL